MVSSGAMDDDPLRILRGIRHATAMDLEIEPVTLKSMRDNVSGLDQVAVERIRQEVWKIFADDNAAKGLWLLNKCDAGECLFGEAFDQSLHNMIAALPHYYERWDSLTSVHPFVTEWLDEEIEQGLNRRSLLLFVLLLQQVDRSLPGHVAERWLLGRKSRKVVSVLASIDDTIQAELAMVAHTPRALYWWTHQKGVEVKSLLLFFACYGLSDASAIETVGSWLPIVSQLGERRQPELVYGRWLTEQLAIEEGPEISRALELLRNAEISGEVSNEEEARNFLSQIYLDSD
jgi:poly(A) polymerase